ncbi:Eco57I restriction-modification methylase domain-containing protein [Achromobacter mucicolens]|uniref:Eco57I restriction-modification methylase domain-containing protein n=1 Tax=Achromobacter mucicolens TaxID=1389922 RepID=UPI0021D09657|nr:Eco57I restriction-modification methylase domain-containing protein [Achromobacter mucicolens]MCU6619087.1 Eco57I restriction-modification methylase domain-containing protein [Achromobacter mucicolens]
MKPSELLPEQPLWPEICPVTDALEAMARESGIAERGAIYTRPEVVEFILDLVGYTSSTALYRKTLLEPSCGRGEFLIAAVSRLLESARAARERGANVPPLDDCIRAVELHADSLERSRSEVIAIMKESGVEPAEASRLAGKWLIQGDFLLESLPKGFDFVIGNPPYVRQERIPEALLREYRRLYSTLYDRADLYVPFIERSLSLLNEGGKLSFICADRWTKNKYGGPLRALIARDFHLHSYVDMVDAPAFQVEVAAYPSITLIERAPPGPTLIATTPQVERKYLRDLAKTLRGDAKSLPATVHKLDNVTNGDEPWVVQVSGARELIRRIERDFPTLEETGCKVGIGVATGADRIYVAKFDELDIEPSRKLPLALTRDILTGHVQWQGYGVVNPFTDEGALVDLKDFPKLAAYLEAHRPSIAGRHVAKRDQTRWYRTIDRITPSLASRPKLLIPDIKGDAQVVYEEGKLYPHHNLYYVVSDRWALKALQAVLLSKLTRLFIATYSVKMRGGFLRFQAQYLRRIRLPKWESVPSALRVKLARAADTFDLSACNEAVSELYGLTSEEEEIVKGS